MRNKHYREDDRGGYAINVGSFDIVGGLGRPRFMEDSNEALLTMGIQNNYGDTNTSCAIVSWCLASMSFNF